MIKSLFPFLLLFPLRVQGDTSFPEPVRETVTRICGFCHYSDFFDDTAGVLIEQRFLDKSRLILDRLQRPAGTSGRMPPQRSPVTLTDAERRMLLEFLQSQTPAPAEDDVPPPP